MAYVYILKSEKNGRFYIGTTEDVFQRLEKHNKGDVFSTKPYRPYKLAYYKKYSDLSEARLIEVRLKKLKRKNYLQKIIANQRIEFGGL